MMDIIEKIKDQLSNPVVLYMKGTPDFPQCGFSGQVIQAMQACDASFIYINILEDPELRETLKAYSNWPTYPQLYAKGELVGGCDIIMDLHTKGELKGVLDTANVSR
ncbi:MAG: Grx4 family monothiol glutaredoxin [Methylococcales bacterium]|nr:Grx4 family monothiol glutaredoxin [Methylococcales bacterium]